MPEAFSPSNCHSVYKCPVGGQRDDPDCVEESYNQTKTNYFFFGVCVHNFRCVNWMWQRQIVTIQGAENICQYE